MRKPIQLAFLLVAGAALAIYSGDYLWLRLRAAYPRFGPAFSTVQMERFYAIELKGGKTEYELDARQPEVTLPCVRCLFPHLGEKPCWYLQRQSQKPIPM
jgi:hypothetical protein